MSSRLLTVTAQAAALSAVSNTLAQGFNVYRERALSSIDPVAFAHFILLAVITTPPNYKWQLALERNFPSTQKKDRAAARKKDDDAAFEDKNGDGNDGKETLSVGNTLAKFLLDQTIGATLNTVFFIAMINLLRSAGWSQIVTAVQRDCLPMLVAGYKFWPFVTLLNLVVVPVEQRMLVGGLAGLAWGVYVSLMNL